MTIDDARAAMEAIEHSSLWQMRNELYAAAVKYAGIRAAWALADQDERDEMNTPRTAAHNAFIDTCNILSRNMVQHGEDNGWRTTIGTDRRDIGDFGCWLHALLGIRVR